MSKIDEIEEFLKHDKLPPGYKYDVLKLSKYRGYLTYCISRIRKLQNAIDRHERVKTEVIEFFKDKPCIPQLPHFDPCDFELYRARDNEE